MTPDAIIFDFDGVIADSESRSAELLGRTLTAAGLPTSEEEALERYTGYGRVETLAAIAARWGERVPPDMAERLAAETMVAFAQPVPPISGVEGFLARTTYLPRAIASSSSTGYIRANLDHIGIAGHFGDHIYSGREHVARSKPFPDIYLHAAAALGIAPARLLVIEDSPVGARAALAAGASVVGLTAGSHCRPALSEALAAEGVGRVFASYAALADHLGLA